MVAYTRYAVDSRVRREAETLASQGFRVLCLTNRTGDKVERYVLDGVEILELDVPKYQGKNPVAYVASYARFLGAASAACARMARRVRLDVVHVHNLPDFLIFAGFLPRIRGSKVVLDVHDSIPETFASKFPGGTIGWSALCLEEKLSALVAHRVICVNHPQRDALVARGIPASKMFISMNIADPRIFKSPATERVARDGEPMKLVYHGTMAGRLGVDLLIHAVARLRGRIPGLELHLWGNGDDLDAFGALARQLDVADMVHFSGRLFPLEELPSRLGVMDVGVVGNRRSVAGELMLPVKLLEYVALGIPAVVPRLKAITYYFADDMVAYYEPDDVGSMAEAIHRFHCQPDLRREQPLRATRFLRDHGWERQGPELVSFYDQLLAS